MINKKLLSLVLKADIIEIIYDSDEAYEDYDEDIVDGEEILVKFQAKGMTKYKRYSYEIISKLCKEWGVEQEYWMDTCVDENKKGCGTLRNFDHEAIIEDYVEHSEAHVVMFFTEFIAKQNNLKEIDEHQK